MRDYRKGVFIAFFVLLALVIGALIFLNIKIDSYMTNKYTLLTEEKTSERNRLIAENASTQKISEVEKEIVSYRNLAAQPLYGQEAVLYLLGIIVYICLFAFIAANVPSLTVSDKNRKA